MNTHDRVIIVGGGLLVIAVIAYVAVKGIRGAASSAASGAVGAVVGTVEGTVVGIGEAIGIPQTEETECDRAIREGRTWDASFACPAGRWIKSLFS